MRCALGRKTCVTLVGKSFAHHQWDHLVDVMLDRPEELKSHLLAAAGFTQTV